MPGRDAKCLQVTSSISHRGSPVSASSLCAPCSTLAHRLYSSTLAPPSLSSIRHHQPYGFSGFSRFSQLSTYPHLRLCQPPPSFQLRLHPQSNQLSLCPLDVHIHLGCSSPWLLFGLQENQMRVGSSAPSGSPSLAASSSVIPRVSSAIESSPPWLLPPSTALGKMVEARFSQDEFLCPVCQDILKDPVTTSCGHSYCKSCITDCWDQEDQKRVYSCPQCRQTFSPRPALALNTMLAEVVKKLKTNLPADCYAGAGDVQCDVCTGRKHKAIKSCLVCLESYCQNHLEQHESWLKGKRHNLTDATGRLQEMICQKHDKILEVFCRTDQKCICVLCMMDEHKNHDTVSTAAQRTEKQHQLKETQRSFQQRIRKREKDLQQLREAVESHKRSAQTAVEDSEKIFSELIHSIKRSRSEATQRIRDQEKTAVSRAEGRPERLEQEINDLRRRDAELEQLSHTQDHIHFLQSFQSLSAPPESTDVNDDPFSSFSSFDGVKESVCQLRDKLEDFCKEELKKISDTVTFTNIVPRTRNDFLQYSHQFTLDLNTVNKRLRLSENNRVITGSDTKQSYPDHPDRFNIVWQVLCRESVCDRRCYWEIEWSGDVRISVSYKSISRKGEGKECWFGSNDQSWSLFCSSSSYSFRHNNIGSKLPVESISSRIGVYVDHSAGTLSFYSVSGDTMILIHTVQTTFTQPLYPGFRLAGTSSWKNLEPVLHHNHDPTPGHFACRVGPLCSTSLPHCGNVCSLIGAARRVSWSLASTSHK
ncbi:Tripartite motif-containing protein 16 [Anabarilius grahami]|uniref:Tripartite motif-containing protein 16 n=1 Tax=Anabarilius grahami TaxID=495550 RepID=A0A3N0XSD3_ANAGA|nr:Tripartite motif-containing protein 16 [Anabarilius grahami]